MGNMADGHEYTWIQGRHMRWDVYPGYHELYNLVEVATGKIMGRVMGSRWRPEAGWVAALTMAEPKPLYGYDTVASAKTALLAAVHTTIEKEIRSAKGTIDEAGETGTDTKTR